MFTHESRVLERYSEHPMSFTEPDCFVAIPVFMVPADPASMEALVEVGARAVGHWESNRYGRRTDVRVRRLLAKAVLAAVFKTRGMG